MHISYLQFYKTYLQLTITRLSIKTNGKVEIKICIDIEFQYYTLNMF